MQEAAIRRCAMPGWLNDAVFYEIYPQSFYDSDGDGIGDINGHGNISLRDSNFTMRILARDNLDIGSKYGTLETVNIQKEIKVNE